MPLLSVEDVTKTYPGVKALQNVSFGVEAGTVHAVMGENGAGKSTLMQIIAGVQQPTSGTLVFEGETLHLTGTRDANHRGIAIVFQELNLAPNLSIAENILLGMEPRAAGVFVDRASARARTQAVLDRLGITLDPDTKVRDLTIAQQQMVEICKSLVHDPRLLIFDEPTSSLSEAETVILFRVIADLRRAGVTMLYISHRMREVFALCDAISILRDGQHVRTMRLADTTPEEIVRLMVGRDLADVQRVPPDAAARPVVLSVRRLTREPQYRDVSFDLHRGEIVGLAGLVGAGRSEVALGVFGAPAPDAGEVHLDGARLAIGRPRTAMRHGIALVPEDRKAQGLVLSLGVRSNMSLAAIRRLSRAGMIDFGAERGLVAPLHRPLPHQDAERRAGGRRAERRQPAEGRAGEMAGDRAPRADRGRADARGGYRDEGGDLRAHARVGRRRPRDPRHLQRPARGADDLGPHPGDARGAARRRAVSCGRDGRADHGACRARTCRGAGGCGARGCLSRWRIRALPSHPLVSLGSLHRPTTRTRHVNEGTA